MLLEHLRHEPIHGAAGGRDQLERLRASAFRFERSRDRLDLALDASHPVEELGLLMAGASE